MPTLNIGFVSSIANFTKKASRAERDAALRKVDVPDCQGDLRDEVGNQFGSLCDFALKRALREASSTLKTVRIADGYGYAEHHKNWLRLGCEILVESEELHDAISFLQDPVRVGMLESRIESVTREFIDQHFPSGMFPELSCALYLLENPTNA